MRVLWLVLFLALLAAPAQAWNDCGAYGSAVELGYATSLTPGKALCHDTTGTTASDMLNVSKCDHFGAYLDPDMDATGAGCEGYLWRCQTNTYSANSCSKILHDVDGDGVLDDVTLDGNTVGRIGFTWETATWVYWQPTANASSKKCRLLVDCK